MDVPLLVFLRFRGISLTAFPDFGHQAVRVIRADDGPVDCDLPIHLFDLFAGRPLVAHFLPPAGFGFGLFICLIFAAPSFFELARSTSCFSPARSWVSWSICICWSCFSPSRSVRSFSAGPIACALASAIFFWFSRLAACFWRSSSIC